MAVAFEKSSFNFKCTPMQKGMLFQNLIAPDDYRNHEQLQLTFTNLLDEENVLSAVQKLTARHDALRTTFLWDEDEEAVRVVNKSYSVECCTVEICTKQLKSYVDEQRELKFNLEKSPPIRWCHLKCDNSRSIILITLHHILMDGASYEVLLSELLSLYMDKPLEKPSNDGIYRYVEWLERQPVTEAKKFWADHLKHIKTGCVFGGSVPGLEYTPDSFDETIKLDISQSRKINDKCNTKGYSLANVFSAAWAMTLHDYVGYEGEVQFGVTRYGRTSLPFECKNDVGIFINTVPLTVNLQELNSVDLKLSVTRDSLNKLRKWEHTPLIEIEKSSPFNGQAIFDSILVFDRMPLYEQLHEYHDPCGLTGVDNLGVTHYPVTVVGKGGDNIIISIEVDLNIVDKNTAEYCLNKLTSWIYKLLELDPINNMTYEYKENRSWQK